MSRMQPEEDAVLALGRLGITTGKGERAEAPTRNPILLELLARQRAADAARGSGPCHIWLCVPVQFFLLRGFGLQVPASLAKSSEGHAVVVAFHVQHQSPGQCLGKCQEWNS